MVKLREHPVRWQAPQPLWGRFGADGAEAAVAPDQARPAILRFATDEFMEQLLGTLERDPGHLDALVARPETWRAPAAEPTDLVERTPVPRRIGESARKSLAGRLRSAVGATAAEAEVVEQARTVRRPLKLFQPAHQRFYLVGASLVCGVAGFPERAVNRGGPEKLSFVIRRLLPATSAADPDAPLHEHAYVKDAEGARWQRVDAGGDVARQVPGEELHPVFPLAFAEAERTRTLWAGLIPVGRREELVTASVDRTPAATLAAGQRFAVSPALPPAPAPSKQARLARFQMEVAEPWKNLIRAAVSAAESLAEKAAEEPALLRRARVFDLNLRQQQTSWLVLLDFADFLAAYLPDVWEAIRSGGAGADQLPQQRRALYQWLGTATLSVSLRNGLKAADADAATRAPSASLREALRSIAAAGVREKLEAMELTYVRSPASLTNSGWPAFHFVLAGLGTDGLAGGPYTFLANLPSAAASEVEADPIGGPDAARTATDRVDRLTALIGRALEATAERDAPPVPFALQLRNALSATSGDAGWFTIRFVYDCRDCGPLHPPVVSEPTQRFQLASFFDPDAPARPIRINLPLDTSPAGLRKYNRNTAFIVSDMLCGQIQRAKGLGLGDLIRSVLPWPLHKSLDLGSGGSCRSGSGLSIGMICSLSIPIITICALILLIVIVSLLDIVFRWLPYFVMCFPVPGLKGKRG
jgi:hypothetical protein